MEFFPYILATVLTALGLFFYTFEPHKYYPVKVIEIDKDLYSVTVKNFLHTKIVCIYYSDENKFAVDEKGIYYDNSTYLGCRTFNAVWLYKRGYLIGNPPKELEKISEKSYS